jgi:hypothetical protein
MDYGNRKLNTKLKNMLVSSAAKVYCSVISTAGFIHLLVGFEVLTAVIMSSYIFWNTSPCSPLKINRRFGGTCRPHLQS